MNYFKTISTLESLKKEYKRLALLNHPDKGGDTAIMQDINRQYQAFLLNGVCFKNNEEANEKTEAAIIYPEIIDQLILLEGIIIEIIGDWIWISGNTYPHRLKLKELNFLFSHSKKLWYFRSAEYKTFNKTPWSIDEIRGKYGSDVVQQKKHSQLT